MVEIKQYHLHPTDQIPNSPRPLLHYKNALPRNPSTTHVNPVQVWDLFTKNEWAVSWIFRYGHTQLSHFHSQAHETMAVLSGTATIRFGVADTSDDLERNTHGEAWEDGSIELAAEAGDVFVIPAGVAHKTYDAKPEAEFRLLTPGEGHGIEAEDPRRILGEIELSGFTMMGAYSGGRWDFVTGGGNYERVWGVPKPGLDPVFGRGEEGLVRTWRGSARGVSELKVRHRL
ncbi:hypothetical protein BJX99DRAFT_259283 [Aspergillus californicus]